MCGYSNLCNKIEIESGIAAHPPHMHSPTHMQQVCSEHKSRLVSARMVVATAAGKAQRRIPAARLQFQAWIDIASEIASTKMKIARKRNLYAEIRH
jgi:hypothetical protein